MARITIDDLPALQDIPAEQLDEIFGAGLRFGPSFEALEGREVLSATLATNTLGVTAAFSLSNGLLTETQGPNIGVVASNVQRLYQGTNGTGQQVAYDLVNNYLYQFDGTRNVWPGVGGASSVAEDRTGAVFFTEGGTLLQATGSISAPWLHP
jgi:hypothetical protein